MYSKPLTQCELTQKRLERLEQKLNLPPIQAIPPLTGCKTRTARLSMRITKGGSQ